jgi:hypothetical protein
MKTYISIAARPIQTRKRLARLKKNSKDISPVYKKAQTLKFAKNNAMRNFILHCKYLTSTLSLRQGLSIHPK